ncbi:bromodomain associated protein [Microdochium bolleyi]|uniref:Transcription initiation factor TFIID subunit 8 n=1 Tax=Microdochium bolleyi TaxID=196109 RepID=A0A136JD12_9PEZI|nr:bromodomain associated protein [Microdochium bolleyi]
MAETPQKRAYQAAESAHRSKPSKKARLAGASSQDSGKATKSSKTQSAETSLYEIVNRPTAQDVGRDGLRRSIALALEHVGFDAATPESLESFTEATETYIGRIVEKLKREAAACRRDNPTPDQYEEVLHSLGISIDSLRPHLKNPLTKEKRKKVDPEYYDPVIEDLYKEFGVLNMSPLFVGHELDGTKEKDEKEWIPASFPGFPALHSYRYTPVEVKSGDPEKQRAEAVEDMRNSEKALRRIDRASKISRQKDLRELATRNPLSKQRSEAWEDLMKDLLPRNGTGSIGALDIADHSTIVNSSGKYLRKELPRTSRRGAAEANG